MPLQERPDPTHVAFDDHRPVTVLPTTLAHHLGLGELVESHVDLRGASVRTNTGEKMLTLAASALAGGLPMADIDDADALCAGGTERVLGRTVKAPSTLGTFLRSFRWGHVRQLDRVSRELLAQPWTARTGPCDRAVDH